MGRILFIGTYNSNIDDEVIIKLARKRKVNFSSLNLNRKFISAISSQNNEVDVIGFPAIPAWPNSKKFIIKNFSKESFFSSKVFNVVLIRNFFRNIKLRKILKKYFRENTPFAIFISELHLPYVKLIKTILKFYSGVVVLLIYDLPLLMNPNSNWFYRFIKEKEQKKIYSFLKYFNNAILLSKFFDEIPYISNIKNKLVIPTIIDFKKISTLKNKVPVISYFGSTCEKYGIINLIKAFKLRKTNYILKIAGSGDMDNYLIDLCKKEDQIKFFGFLTGDKMEMFLSSSDAFVNPRIDNDEFSKYSFPSKIGTYLEYEKPIITYQLKVYTKEIIDSLVIVKNNTPEDLAVCIDEFVRKINKSDFSFNPSVNNLSIENVGALIKERFFKNAN